MKRYGLPSLLSLLICCVEGGGSDDGGAPGGGAAGGGGGAPGAGGSMTPPDNITGGGFDNVAYAAQQAGIPTDAVGGFRNFLAAQGTPINAAAALYVQNFQLRTHRRQTTEQEARHLFEQQGSRILSKEESEAYAKLIARGKPDEILAGLDERDTLRTEKQGREYDALIDSAAKLHGYKPGAVFRSFIKANGLEVVVDKVDVRDDAKGTTDKVERAFVVERDGQKKETGRVQLDEYLTKKFADDEPALRDDGAASTGARGAQQQQTNAPAWVRQPAPRQTGNGGGNANPAAAHISSTYGHLIEGDKGGAGQGK